MTAKENCFVDFVNGMALGLSCDIAISKDQEAKMNAYGIQNSLRACF